MSEAQLLIVEDEPSFAEALTVGLEREGFGVSIAVDGPSALERFEQIDPDLVLLDIMLPGLSGIEVCRQIRRKSHVPIIMVTAKSSEIDSVVGLEVGADDYVTKPYRLRELVARIRAVLRRAELSDRDLLPPAPFADDSLSVGDVKIDIARHEVWVRDELVRLRLREFELLALLMEHAGRVLTRETLMDRVWGERYAGDTKTLDVHVKRLRAHIEHDPHHPERIVTIRGLGYKFVG
ncbi:MAG: response regulator [Acidimicrobiia bacterium]